MRTTINSGRRFQRTARPAQKAVVLAAGILMTALALAGCAAPGGATSPSAKIAVVATTNVYGDIADQVGGSLVEVTSVISSPSQDPHSFEASARIQLALSRAAVVIENGGGYDAWAGQLLAGAGDKETTVISVSDLSGYDQDPAGGEFNEHLWYDFPTVERLARRLAETFALLDPASTATFQANADSFVAGLDALKEREDALKASFAGTGVAVTEPVPLYLLDAIGLENVTPRAFSDAVEQGVDVPPLVLEKTLALFGDGTARLLVYNEQAAGPETEQLLAAARAAGVPVVPMSETLPAGQSYLSWMASNLDAIEAALR